MLGVCNGFQILTEAGLLPGALLRNAALRFLSMDCFLRVERSDTDFTRHYQAGQVFRSPMAHGDGNYFADDDTLDRLEGEGLVAFRYATPRARSPPAANRNGSARNIAGIYSPNLRVLGLMPHPEDLVDPLMGGTDGKPAVRRPGGARCAGLHDGLMPRATSTQARSPATFGLDRPTNTPASSTSWAARRR